LALVKNSIELLRMKKIVLLFLSVLLFSSCVSRKRLTYLQETESDEGKKYELNRSQYQVQPNDILNITIRSFDQETAAMFNSERSGNLAAGDLVFYLTGFSIDLAGNISMPVIGKVNVVGKTTEEIKELIEQKLNDYFKEGAVFVSVQLAGVRFSVVGDVSRPGKYVIYQNQVNIFEALAQAGDITIVGDRREVQIVRQTNEGVKTINLNLTDKNILTSPYYFIQPNDIINVKPLAVKSFGIGTTGFQTFASVLGVLASTATLIFTLSRIQ